MAVTNASRPDYNDRLFSPGVRGWIHLARFRWLKKQLQRLRFSPKRVVELGCFDGKTVDFLPEKPQFYHGFDANWEGGLDLAAQRFVAEPQIVFSECSTADAMVDDGPPFDTAICMETLEHVPPSLVEPYVRRLAEMTRGYIFITVPNEKGVVFLSKFLAKKCLGNSTYRYSLREAIHATLGKLHRVERNEHKGFDYRGLIDLVDNHFSIVDVSGMPLRRIPASLNLTVGIVARSKAA